MVTLKNPKLAIQILILLLIAAVSVFFVADTLSETTFIQEARESVGESQETVMGLSMATLSASLAISAFPGDFASPLAQSLADMNVYFVLLLMVLFLEQMLLRFGVQLAFRYMIPVACVVGAAAIGARKDMLKSLATRILVLALAVAFVVPCSTHVTEIAGAEYLAYIDETIAETSDSADKISEAAESGGETTIFEKLSELFHTAIKGVEDFLQYVKNIIRKCMNSIAILIISNFVMPLVTFAILKWVLKETFNIVLPSTASTLRQMKKTASDFSKKSEEELAVVGEEKR